MQSAIISGNLGGDAVLRSTQGGDQVLAFNVGVKQGYGDKTSTNWFRCSMWGKRGANLQQYLLKGTKVVVSGDFTIGSFEGKPQYEIRVNDVEMMSRSENAGNNNQHQQAEELEEDRVPF